MFTGDNVPLMGDASPELQSAVRTLLDCFSGADSGGSFYAFCRLMVFVDKQAQNSADIRFPAAKKIRERVIAVANLIKYAEKEMRDAP